MNWVSIDKDICNECGICVLRCPDVFRETDDKIAAQADEMNCSPCGHCVSLCPTEAIVHHKMDMDNFIDLGDDELFETDKFIQFIRRRRSHRVFKNKPIPQQDLEKLVDTCRYAPTGGNAQNVHIIVVRDKDKIEKLSDLTIDFFKELGTSFEKKIEKLKTDGKEIPADLQGMVLYRDRLTAFKEAGINPIFYNAPAVIIFHAPETSVTPKDDCVIASTTMGLTAMTMGLESTYIGLFEMAALGYPDVNGELQLPEGHKVYSVLILGYPGFRYLRTVDREAMRIRWE